MNLGRYWALFEKNGGQPAFSFIADEESKIDWSAEIAFRQFSEQTELVRSVLPNCNYTRTRSGYLSGELSIADNTGTAFEAESFKS